MKLNEKDRKLFIETFDRCLVETEDAFIEYKNAVLEVMDKHNFETVFDFNEFGKEAFLHFLKTWHDRNFGMEDILKRAKDILSDKE